MAEIFFFFGKNADDGVRALDWLRGVDGGGKCEWMMEIWKLVWISKLYFV